MKRTSISLCFLLEIFTGLEKQSKWTLSKLFGCNEALFDANRLQCFQSPGHNSVDILSYFQSKVLYENNMKDINDTWYSCCLFTKDMSLKIENFECCLFYQCDRFLISIVYYTALII